MKRKEPKDFFLESQIFEDRKDWRAALMPTCPRPHSVHPQTLNRLLTIALVPGAFLYIVNVVAVWAQVGKEFPYPEYCRKEWVLLRTKSRDNVLAASTAGWPSDRPGRVDTVRTAYWFKGEWWFWASSQFLYPQDKTPAGRVALGGLLGC